MLLAGMSKLKRTKKKQRYRETSFRLGEENAKHVVLDCLETRNWRKRFLNGKRLNVKKEIAYMEILRCTNENETINLGRYIDKAKCKWFKETK